MSEQVKFIVDELNKAPFSKKFNLISFDALQGDSLLQLLSDVCCEIDQKPRIDVREEDTGQTALRLLQFLRIVKYQTPQSDANALSQFRQGLVQGDKHVAYPVLEWLLQRVTELKKRCYLAKYLVKIDVPVEILQDEQVSNLLQQCEELMERFKETHRAYERVHSAGFNTSDLKQEIAQMETEKEHLTRRVDRLRDKVQSLPNSTSMLQVSRSLREERDKEQRLLKQRHEQKNLLQMLDQRAQRLRNQLKDAKQSGIGASSHTLMEHVEEEVKVNTYLVRDKLPKELEAKKKTISVMQKVVNEPAIGQSDLDKVADRTKGVNTEINQLVEKRMMSDPTDDKLMRNVF